jgi:hypothetical protein
MPRTLPQDDFCQVYYPDRPKRGGFEAMGVVLRGDIMKTLAACGAFGTSASSTQAAPTQFCNQLLNLRTVAPQGFQSIDLGHMKGEATDIHQAAVQLLNGKCFITRKPAETPYYLCAWDINEKSRVDIVGNALAGCLGARADWVDKNGVKSLTIDSASVEYRLLANAGRLLLNVKPTVRATGVTKADMPACQTRPWIAEFFGFYRAHDQASAQAYLDSNKCFAMKGGVSVTIVAIDDAYSQFEFQGSRYWTLTGALTH